MKEEGPEDLIACVNVKGYYSRGPLSLCLSAFCLPFHLTALHVTRSPRLLSVSPRLFYVSPRLLSVSPRLLSVSPRLLSVFAY